MENRFCIKKTHLVIALMMLVITASFVFGRLSVTNNYSINSKAAETSRTISSDNKSAPFAYFKIYKTTKIESETGSGYKNGELVFDGISGKNFPLLEVNQLYFLQTLLKGAPTKYFSGNDKVELGMNKATKVNASGCRPPGSCQIFSYTKKGTNYKIDVKYFMRDKKLNNLDIIKNFVLVYFK